MKQILEVLVSFINPTIVIVFTIVLIMANTYIFKKLKSVSSANDVIRRTLSILIGLTGIIAFILALPIDGSLKGQVLGFLGIVVSAGIALSSTTVLGNLIAGIMNNAMKRFKLGDLIKVNELQGRVTKKGIFHTEIQLEDSNFITVPNLYIATNPVKLTRKTNTVVSTTVSLGYDIPRLKIEELLKQAALDTGLSDPYLYITNLGDYSVNYKIHGFLADSGKYFMTSSKLNGCVMDILHANEIEIASPTIMNQRRADDYVFIPKKEHRVEKPVEDINPELLVFEEALESAKAEEKKAFIERMSVKKKELQDLLKETKDTDKLAQIEMSISRIDSIVEKLKKDLEAEKE